MTHRLTIPTLVSLLLIAATGSVSSAAGPIGHWEGAIDLPNTKLEIRVDLAQADSAGDWSGTIDIPAQSLRGFKLGDVAVAGSRVSFRLPNIPGDPEFAGNLADDGNRISGQFSQSGQTFPFTIERRASTARAGETPSRGIPGEGLVGHWQGSLLAGPMELRLVLHVKSGDDGGMTATIDSLDQGANGIPVSAVKLTDGKVHLELAGIRATYDGQLSADGSEITGNWKQGPLDAPLVFRRLAARPELARPQEPKKPYPYDKDEVTFTGGAPDVTLAGTLTMPRGEGPFPAVVLLSGSGPQDRDETVAGHRPFLVLADHLTRQGIAVLRYDDRGYARSTGSHRRSTHVDFAADARAAFDFLRKQPRIDPARVGLCGHSEGAVHAPIVAAEEKHVAFIVMLAGVGVPLEQLLQRQREDVLRSMGIDEETVKEQLTLGTELAKLLREMGGTDEARAKLRDLLREATAKYTPAQLEATGFTEGVLEQQIAVMTTPWYIELLRYDPAPTLAQVDCPVLALNGKKDTQVAWEDNLEGIRTGLAAGGNTDVTTKAFPELNHLFQHARTGAIAEYGTIEETMSPDVLRFVSDWILEQTNSEPVDS